MSEQGWAEMPGGTLLGRLIAEAFDRAAQSDRDRTPCPRCGGDRLRADFTSTPQCHVAVHS